jgi:hypothetical protein
VNPGVRGSVKPPRLGKRSLALQGSDGGMLFFQSFDSYRGPEQNAARGWVVCEWRRGAATAKSLGAYLSEQIVDVLSRRWHWTARLARVHISVQFEARGFGGLHWL